MNNQFRRRIYSGWGAFWSDVRLSLAYRQMARQTLRERVSLAYAQHWAERDARPDPDAEDRLRAIYGADGTDAIHSVLRMIRIGNLLGNTGDYWLYRLSFGHLGIRADERRFAVAEPIPAQAQPGG